MNNKVVAEFNNTKTIYKWRLKKSDETSEWSSYYEGLLTHRFLNGDLYGLATAYWEGTLPIEVPFKIVVDE